MFYPSNYETAAASDHGLTDALPLFLQAAGLATDVAANPINVNDMDILGQQRKDLKAGQVCALPYPDTVANIVCTCISQALDDEAGTATPPALAVGNWPGRDL